MSENTLANTKWTKIPDETPMYEVLQAAGFPEPMIILKHLSKPNKTGKTPDLSKIISFFWMSKGEIQEMLEGVYYTVSHNDQVRKYLMTHPKHSLHLLQALNQIKEEPISTLAARNANDWIKLLIDDEAWQLLMNETPLTLATKVQKLFSDTDYMNMPLSEYWSSFDIGTTLEKASIGAVANHFVEAEAEEQRFKQLKAELEAAGLGELTELLKRYGNSL